MGFLHHEQEIVVIDSSDVIPWLAILAPCGTADYFHL